MTAAAWVLLAVAAVFALGDWVAVGHGKKALEYVCKPAVTAALVATAATVDAAQSDVRAWFVAALVCCLAGDVFLMLPGDRFVPGLGSFLVAHALFVVGFSLHPGGARGYAVGVVVVAAVGLPLVVRFVGALRRSGGGELVAPVIAYFVAISAMVVSAIAGGDADAVTGAVLFFVSDGLIAETRFVGTRRGAPVAIMVTYHLALAALVVSLV
ncbi:MAG TPA: lysoplasmalogenase [Acidimicrobiia bacterium]|nr:lysoplasmalogenase [Acidimicrobiia bacterium]